MCPVCTGRVFDHTNDLVFLANFQGLHAFVQDHQRGFAIFAIFDAATWMLLLQRRVSPVSIAAGVADLVVCYVMGVVSLLVTIYSAIAHDLRLQKPAPNYCAVVYHMLSTIWWTGSVLVVLVLLFDANPHNTNNA